MDKKKVRDYCRLAGAVACCFLYIPHLIVGSMGGAVLLLNLMLE